MVKKKSEISQAPPGGETPPEGDPEITSEATDLKIEEGETFTYTKQEREDFVNAAKGELGRELSEALSANTVLKATSDAQGTRITGLEGAMTKMREERRQKELKEVEGNTELIDGIKLKHQNEDKELDLSSRESVLKQGTAQHQADIDAVAKSKAEILAKELAKTSGLTESLILQIGTDTADGRTTYNLDRMKAVASKAPREEGDEEVDEEDEDAVAAAANAKLKGQKARAASTSRSAATRGYRTYKDYEEAYAKGEISVEQLDEATKRFNIV